jgi:hypothetical protein
MPINTFSSFTDGLDSNRRSREHFITNINLNEDRLWVPPSRQLSDTEQHSGAEFPTSCWPTIRSEQLRNSLSPC